MNELLKKLNQKLGHFIWHVEKNRLSEYQLMIVYQGLTSVIFTSKDPLTVIKQMQNILQSQVSLHGRHDYKNVPTPIMA